MFWSGHKMLRGAVLLCAVFLVAAQVPDDDGKPALWDAKIRSQLAPEIKPLFDSQTAPFDAMEVLKAAVDNQQPVPATFLKSVVGDAKDLPTLLMLKGTMDTMSPGFKLPPGVSVPFGAVSAGHMVMAGPQVGKNGERMWGIPNAEKNHMSGVQRDAIAAAVATMRTNNPAPSQADAWGTRQSAGHVHAPSYTEYLKRMMHTFGADPGQPFGTVPQFFANRATMTPFGPMGVGPLGGAMLPAYLANRVKPPQ